MALLFSPFTIKNTTFKNRIVVSPMCQYSAIDGFATDWHLVHLGSRAVGGAGLVIQEATAVSPEGRITNEDLGIWKDEHIEKLQTITTFIKANGSVAGIQLAHAGRKASFDAPWSNNKRQLSEANNGWTVVAPSAIPFNEADNAPDALTTEGINKVINDFKNAAVRALKAGYEVLEIHAAHGYLLHEFLSPFSNKRNDDYGGTFENRIRILIEIIDAVNTVWSAESPLFVRISATEWTEGAWTENDSVKLALVLKQKGVDLIDCSTGGNIPHVKIPLVPGYQVPVAATIKQKAGIATGAVGLITSAEQAENILQNQQADLIFFARELLRDPYFPIHAAKALGVEITWPLQYERAKN